MKAYFISTILLFFTVINVCHSKKNPTEEYLKNHSEKINFNDIKLNFDDSFYDHQLFFFGFVHGSATPQLIDLALLKNLNKKGVRYYAPEVDYSLAFFFNEYLKTGDLELLRFACEYQGHITPQDASVQLFQKWQSIYEYNKSLKTEEKITVLGWDHTISPSLSLTHLAYLAPSESTGLDIVDSLIHFKTLEDESITIMSGKPVWKSGKSWDYFFGTDKTAFYNRFNDRYAVDSTEILKAFGQNAHQVRRLMQENKNTEREKIIYSNFKQYGLAKLKEGEKIYSTYGYFHVQQNKVNDYMPFAGRIREKDDIRLVTLISLMAKSECLVHQKYKSTGNLYIKDVKFKGAVTKGHKTSKSYEGDHLFEKVEGIKDLQKIANGAPITLFNLIAKNSPYKHSSSFASMKRGKRNWRIEEEKYTTDYFQYVFLIQNSKPNIPIQEMNN